MAFLEDSLHIHSPGHIVWRQLLGCSDYVNNRDIYVFHADHIPPQSWLKVATITRKKSETIACLLASLVECDHIQLVHDATHGTYDSLQHLSGGPAKRKELHTLKKLVSQRQQELGLRVFSCAPPETVNHNDTNMTTKNTIFTAQQYIGRPNSRQGTLPHQSKDGKQNLSKHVQCIPNPEPQLRYRKAGIPRPLMTMTQHVRSLFKAGGTSPTRKKLRIPLYHKKRQWGLSGQRAYTQKENGEQDYSAMEPLRTLMPNSEL
ncbi:hypothetical protein VNI00_017483 [Paramarasmius palmivorus]|uniref:Uncharacterized protein n=1 Tax=Paramarasmius palmivorus TaxID=297713 RepID=A0AAW0B6S8_9AGAR